MIRASRFFYWCFLLVALLLPELSFAKILFVEFSDNHSAYDNLPPFLESFAATKANFLTQNPDGQVIIVVNGDFGGQSAYSVEKGWLGIQALQTLAADNTVLYTLGNHDGFDFSTSDNVLVKEQLTALHQAGVQILGKNIDFSDDVRDLVQDHFEISFGKGRKLRVYGFGLEIFFRKSNWVPTGPTKVINEMRNTFDEMSSAVRESLSSGVTDLVFFAHEGFEVMKTLTQQIQDTFETQMSQAGLRFGLVFAAHDHLQKQENVRGANIVDSRSNYDFSTVEMDDDGKITKVRFMDAEARSQFQGTLDRADSHLARFFREANRALSELREKLDKVIGSCDGFSEIKANLKAGRAVLGIALADMISKVGFELQTQDSKFDGLPIVAFYNSSSYRLDEPFPKKITYGLMDAIYPLAGDITVRKVTRQEMQILFESQRRRRLLSEKNYTPQISSNLYETDDFKLNLVGENGPADARPDDWVLLVLDAWLSKNGNKVPEWDAILNAHTPLIGKEQRRFLVEEGASSLKEFHVKDLSPEVRSSVQKRSGLRCEALYF